MVLTEKGLSFFGWFFWKPINLKMGSLLSPNPREREIHKICVIFALAILVEMNTKIQCIFRYKDILLSYTNTCISTKNERGIADCGPALFEMDDYVELLKKHRSSIIENVEKNSRTCNRHACNGFMSDFTNLMLIYLNIKRFTTEPK